MTPPCHGVRRRERGSCGGIKRPGRISLTHRFIGILPSDKCLVPETPTSKPNIREELEFVLDCAWR